MIELKQVGPAVQLWAATPTDVTVLVTGKANGEAGRLARAVLPINRVLNTVNGKPNFWGLFFGLTIARYSLQDSTTALVVTPGGSLLKVKALKGDLPLDLTSAAIRHGLLKDWKTVAPAMPKAKDWQAGIMGGVYETHSGETD
jgi:hypothetical protein